MHDPMKTRSKPIPRCKHDVWDSVVVQCKIYTTENGCLAMLDGTCLEDERLEA